MRSINLLLIAFFLLSTDIALADLITVSGDVSGTWSADTMLVTGEIRVPPGETLTIMPGVEVLFEVYCKFIVDSTATLIAVGDLNDVIRFDELTPGIHWHGIRFWSASDSSRLEYCHFYNGSATGFIVDRDGGAIYCYNSSPTIQHCLFENCSATNYSGAGGAIYCSERCNSIISDNVFNGNSAYYDGGAISCYCANPTISHCTFSGNSAEVGGGFYCYQSNPVITDNIFIDNSAGSGGGINCYGSFPAIRNNIFIGNSADYGGAISCMHFIPVITGNTMTKNTATWGGGIYCSAPAIIMNNTFSRNYASAWGGGIYCYQSSPSIANCIFWGNVYQQIIYGSPLVTYSNVQGGWPGTGNIDEEPLFVLAEEDDYRLLWGSPCIDSGDPDSLCNDPDGTRADMGAHYYDQSVPVRILLTPFDAPLLIPAEGGRFDYSITASNCTDFNLTMDHWCDLTTPSGSIYGPGQPPAAVTIPANGNIHMIRTQRVSPAMGVGPSKSLIYNGYAAVSADTSKDSFTFSRLGLSAGGCTANGPIQGKYRGMWSTFDSPLIPSSFSLDPCCPNPFNPITTISFTLPQAGFVRLEVFDVTGRNIGSPLVNGRWEAGQHSVVFNGSNLPSGIYIYHLEAGEFAASGKMVLLK